MEFSDVVKARRSVRAFQEKGIDGGMLHAIVDSIMLAPSAGNLQSYRFHIVKNQNARQGLQAACMGQEFVAQAPVLLVFSADKKRAERKYGERGAELYAVQDATIAAAYCQLAAANLGLGTVWVGAFDQLEVSRIIDAGAYEVPVAIIPVGYAAEEPERKQRRKVSEIITEI